MEAVNLPHPGVKPRMRGVLHSYAFFVSLVTGAVLIVAASGARAIAAVSIYASTIATLFGVSALYHRINWSPGRRRWMRRLDHSMIFLLIAGTYTPICLLALSGTLAVVVLSVVWGGAATGILLKLFWLDAPTWLVAAVYVALGWAGAAALPQIATEAGVTVLVLVLTGGILYSVGALVYARKSPDPVPTVFGYHEVFHSLVIVAAVLHYTAVLFFVVPAA